MARKNIIRGYKLFNAVNATTTQTSNETNVAFLDRCSIHLKWTAANTGTLKVEARNQRDDSDDAPWYELDFGTTLSVTAATEVQLVLKEMPFTGIRVVWTPSAGSGTLTARLHAKTEGA